MAFVIKGKGNMMAYKGLITFIDVYFCGQFVLATDESLRFCTFFFLLLIELLYVGCYSGNLLV